MEQEARVQPDSRAEWRAWLEEHHADASGVWLVTWNARTGRPSVSYDEAVEEALCFGWIDSQLAPGEAELTVTFPAQCGSARVMAEGAFETLRRALPDTDVYVLHAA